MSLTRLILLDKNDSVSGLIPSHAIPSILFAIANGAPNLMEFWPFVQKIDPGLETFFHQNLDAQPILEGYGDGLLVINWEHRCIESFQAFQPIRRQGTARYHTGEHTNTIAAEEPYQIPDAWHIIDHHFEESRH